MTHRTLLAKVRADRGQRGALAVALAASLTAAVTVSPATAAARALSRPAGSTLAGSPAGGAAASILLVNGDHALVSSAAGRHTTGILRAPGISRLAGELTTLRAGAKTFLFPTVALPYLGRGLDPSLFELTALRHAEHGGRLPVTLHYQGRPHTVPGIMITHRGAGTARGYLTASSAPAFGAALARQMLGDRARGSYGQDGLFAGGLSIGLPGTPGTRAAPARGHRVHFPMHTLTVRGTNLAGRPDTGDLVFVANVTDPDKFFDFIETTNFFYHGTAKFSVPDGIYWAFGDFLGPGGAERLDVLPQFTVRGDTTVATSARAANSEVTFATPRPAVNAGALAFSMVRRSRRSSNSWTFFGSNPFWVNRTSQPPTAGSLDTATSTTLISPRGSGTPYAYALDFPAPPGIIPSQHFVVRPADLATVHERYYQDSTQRGGWLTFGGTARQSRTVGFSGSSTPLRHLPGQQTLYLTAHPATLWQTNYFVGLSSGQTNAWRLYHGGQDLSETWNAYPLHPSPNVSLPGSIFPALPSASRAKNTLLLDITPFSDNTFGHTGTGFQGGFGPKVSGSYALYQNGTKIAGGKPPQSFNGDLFVRAALSRAPARIRFVMTASRKGKAPDLASASQDVWTWPSRPDPAAAVPAPWYCGATIVNRKIVFDRHCAIQGMMTLGYRVAGLSMHGATHPGRQALSITVNHLQLGGAARITDASLQVSYDKGASWQHVALTRAGAIKFGASYTAPASASVSLRASARDARGATVTETILGAYRTSS